MNSQGDNTPTRTGLDDLLTVMQRLESLHQELREALQQKLEHMRRADQTGIQACLDREQVLVRSIIEQEGLRKQIMEQVGRGYGLGAKTARTMPARRLAERVTEPSRSRLNELADRLKSVVQDVKRINGLVTRVSQEVLGHLTEVFTTLTGSATPASGYSRAGRTVEGRPRELFETVG